VAVKRVIIVPVAESGQFPSMEILVRGRSIAALVGETFEGRSRSTFDSNDSFLYSVGLGQADLYTFNNLDEAANFAKGKIEALMELELTVITKTDGSDGLLKITTIAIPISGRRSRRA
jgi:hypothetical protein